MKGQNLQVIGMRDQNLQDTLTRIIQKATYACVYGGTAGTGLGAFSGMQNVAKHYMREETGLSNNVQEFGIHAIAGGVFGCAVAASGMIIKEGLAGAVSVFGDEEA